MVSGTETHIFPLQNLNSGRLFDVCVPYAPLPVIIQFLVLATANHSDATSGAKAPSWPILPQDDPRRKRLATSTLSHTDVDEDAETKKAGRVHRSPSRAPPAPRALCRAPGVRLRSESLLQCERRELTFATKNR